VQTSSGAYQISRSKSQIEKDIQNFDGIHPIRLSKKEKIALIKFLNNLQQQKTKRTISNKKYEVLKDKAIYKMILAHLSPNDQKKLRGSQLYKKNLSLLKTV
jgi:hypothetical protein